MADRTHSSTPKREVGLSAAVAAANATIEVQNKTLASQKPPGKPLPLRTNDSYFAARVDDLLDSYANQHRADIAARAVKAFMAAPPSAQGQILALMGLTAYKGLPPDALGPVLSTLGLTNFLALSDEDQNKCFTLAGLTE